MTDIVPRVLLCGTGSGCGKTTVTMAVLGALTERGVGAAAFKCGPDYIDPMFHSHITGTAGGNLDPFFFSENTLRYLLAKRGRDRDFSVIEGVMGYYDGIGLSHRASTWEVAKHTQSPAVLVVRAKGAALSALAVIRGFRDFLPDSGVSGVIFNQCSAMLYPSLRDAVLERFGGAVRPLGFLPPMPDCSLESRHLGLVTAAEVEDLDAKLSMLARQAAEGIDLDGLLALGQTAPPVEYMPVALPRSETSVRIAVARDRAFCFYYADSLDALREMGAELVPFSPLTDAALPENVHGLYLGGGYPELYAETLGKNTSMLSSVRERVAGGLPCIAECGGFMYLTEAIAGTEMAGVLPGSCSHTGRLRRFGYLTLTAKRDNLLCRAGESVPAHEFHYWDAEFPGTDFTAVKPTGKRWDCAVGTETLYAGFPHFHFYANPEFAVRFYQACIKERETCRNS